MSKIWGKLLGDNKYGKTNSNTHNNIKKQTSIEDKFEDLNCFVKFVVIEQLSAEFLLLQNLVFGHSLGVYWESPRDHPKFYLCLIA